MAANLQPLLGIRKDGKSSVVVFPMLLLAHHEPSNPSYPNPSSTTVNPIWLPAPAPPLYPTLAPLLQLLGMPAAVIGDQGS